MTPRQTITNKREGKIHHLKRDSVFCELLSTFGTSNIFLVLFFSGCSPLTTGFSMSLYVFSFKNGNFQVLQVGTFLQNVGIMYHKVQKTAESWALEL